MRRVARLGDGGPEPVRDAGRDAGPDAGNDSGVRTDAGMSDGGRGDACPPIAEVCNLVDDDCDGTVDETPAEGACAVPNATAACMDGTCRVAVCAFGFEDCNGDPADGCETSVEDDRLSCGACGSACGSGIACRDGVCDDQRLVQITAGYYHSCAVRSSGEALCWGWNPDGQLGTGDRTERLIATPVSGGRRFVALLANWNFTCGILVGGGVACWGSNVLGQLGDGTRVDRLRPVDAIGPAAIVGLASVGASGNGSALALTSSGEVWAWGHNDHGQLGVPPAPPWPSVRIPPFLAPLAGVISLSGGAGYGCGVFSDATVDCWGTPGGSVPMSAASIRWRSVHAGQAHTCAIDEAGDLHCWGDNAFGQVGPFPCTDCRDPMRVPLPGAVADASPGHLSSCALLESGAAMCWGRESATPVAVPVPGRVDALAMSWSRVCALDARARAWCWRGGWVGDGTDVVRDAPVEVLGVY